MIAIRLFLACVALLGLSGVFVCFMADVSRMESAVMSIPFLLSVFAAVALMLIIVPKREGKRKVCFAFNVISLLGAIVSAYYECSYNLLAILSIVVITNAGALCVRRYL
jgi:hypothetical protein